MESPLLAHAIYPEHDGGDDTGEALWISEDFAALTALPENAIRSLRGLLQAVFPTEEERTAFLEPGSRGMLPLITPGRPTTRIHYLTARRATLGTQACVIVSAYEGDAGSAPYNRVAAHNESLARILKCRGEDPQPLMDRTLEEAIGLTGSKVGFIFLYDEKTGRFTLSAFSRDVMPADGTGTQPGSDLQTAGFWAEAVRRRQPIVLNDFTAHYPSKKGFPTGHAPIRRFLCVPVLDGDTIASIIAVANKEQDYTDLDVDQIRLLMDAVWRVIQQRRTHLELRASEQRYRSLVEASSDWVWEIDLAGRYTYASPQVEQILGYRVTEILGKTPFDLMPPEEARRIREPFDTLFAAPRPFRGLENINLHKDGRPVVLETSGTPVFSPAGEFRGYRGMDRDITERRDAEARLKLHGAALELAANAVIISDRDHRIRWVNRAFTRITGWTLDEVQGTVVLDLPGTVQSASVSIEELTAAIDRGEVWHSEHISERKDGTTYDQDLTITPLHDDRGDISHFIVILQDITERKRFEQRLLQAQRLESIGTLAGGIAHDLNNIFTPITIAAELLLPDNAGSADRRLFDVIHSQAKRGAGIVRQLLAFSRGLSAERHRVEVRYLINELTHLMRETFPRHLLIQAELAPDLWPVMGDQTQLHQVLLNLCVNARDAMPERGRLTIAARNTLLTAEDSPSAEHHPPGPYVVVEVRDNGHGIPAAIRDRIFDPFFTTKPIGTGTGLGLSTVLGIVQKHGGFITLESDPSVGTCFFIHLPACPQRESSGEVPSIPPVAPGNSELVLLVDDEVTIRDATRAALEQNNYRVLTAANGREASKLLLQHAGSVQLVLTDIMMPEMDGVSLVRFIRSMFPQTPVIAMSGWEDEQKRHQLASCGLVEILAKPYRISELLLAVRQALDAAGGG